MSFGSRTLIAQSLMANEIKSLKGLNSNEAEDVSGRTSAEIERVVYVRVKDFGWLERASGAERQEQWSIKIPKTESNAGAGSIRVRKSINLREPGAAVSYVLTTKLEIGSKGSCAETPEPSSLDQLNIFKYLADTGMIKDRYYFPIEGSDLQWEVDCFPKAGEMYHDWVKIDLESWPRGKELPALPMEFVEMLDGSEGLQTPEAEEKIKTMYETMFLTKNTNQPLADYGNSDAPPAGAETNEDGQQQQNDNPDANANPDNPDDNAGGDDNTGGDDTSTNNNDAGGDDQSGGGNDNDNPDGKDDVQKEVTEATDELGKATTEAFSSMGQVLVPMIPILGPLVTAIYGHRGMDMTAQHTKKSVSKIDRHGHKTTSNTDTGSFTLTDMTDAKDYIGLIEKAVGEANNKKKDIDRIDMTLWPQKDGRFGVINIKTDRNGETRIFTENNPGSLKWFSMSLAGKRVIRLKDEEISKFKFNGRTISCPFQGDIVEFDVGQLRQFKYQTKDGSNGFDVIEYNFDA